MTCQLGPQFDVNRVWMGNSMPVEVASVGKSICVPLIDCYCLEWAVAVLGRKCICLGQLNFFHSLQASSHNGQVHTEIYYTL